MEEVAREAVRQAGRTVRDVEHPKQCTHPVKDLTLVYAKALFLIYAAWPTCIGERGLVNLANDKSLNENTKYADVRYRYHRARFVKTCNAYFTHKDGRSITIILG